MTRALSIWIMFAIIAAGSALIWTKANATPQRLHIAKQYIGLKEGTRRANKAMGVNTRRVPWCGYYVAAVVRKSGRKPVKGYPSARSWERFGTPVKLAHIRPGDIVTVYSRRARSKRHVGIYSHRSQGKVCLIGGNQSNRVKVSCYSAKLVRAVRR